MQNDNVISQLDRNADVITYKGVNYPVRYIANGAAISIVALNEAITADNFEGEAEQVDNNICGYVELEEILLPTKELTKVCREAGIID